MYCSRPSQPLPPLLSFLPALSLAYHSLEEVDVREPDFDVRLEAVLEYLVELGDPSRDGVVDLLLLVQVAGLLKCRNIVGHLKKVSHKKLQP